MCKSNVGNGGVVGVRCAICRSTVIMVNKDRFMRDLEFGGAFYFCRACVAGLDEDQIELRIEKNESEDKEAGLPLDGTQLLINQSPVESVTQVV